MNKMYSLIAKSLFLGILLSGLIGIQLTAEDCSLWQSRELAIPPDWYEASLASATHPVSTPVSPHSLRTTYSLLNSTTLVKNDRYLPVDQYTPTPEDTEYYWYPYATLSILSKDSVLLDVGPCGFSKIVFDSTTNMIVAFRHKYVDDNGDVGGDIVVYELDSLSKEFLHVYTHNTEISLDPGWPIAYNDLGDLYVCYNTWGGPDLVFRGGNIHSWRTPCGDKCIRDIRWSPDGKSIVFKYGDRHADNVYQLYEASVAVPREGKDSASEE